MTQNGDLLDKPEALQSHIIALLRERCGCESLFRHKGNDGVRPSSVMVLLGEQSVSPGKKPEICVILTKRSERLPQPGDLCCPGGAVKNGYDGYLARALSLPGLPLAMWPEWKCLQTNCPDEAKLLSLLLATGLRESYEEMRLNPLFVRFLGPLQSQCLLLFRRVIHPMVGWVRWQNRFFPSWEVDKIIRIPLRALLNPAGHACYRLYVPPRLEWRFYGNARDFPCFLYSYEGRVEILWGVTYRIITLFLEMIFGFRPPPMESLPLVPGRVDETYITGKKRA